MLYWVYTIMIGGEPMKKRIRKIAVTAAVLVLILLLCLYGNLHLTVTQYTFVSSKLPESFDGFRIVQLSDLHNTDFGGDNAWLLEKLEELDPDIVVFTGDIVDSNRLDMDVSLRLAQALPCDSYYITGNHEYCLSKQVRESLIEGLKAAGTVCLLGENMEIQRDGASINLVGLDDCNLTQRALESLTDPDAFNLVLAHEPQLLDEYSGTCADLVLTGHAHGGQIRLPGIGGLYAPDQGVLPRYTAGIFEQDGTSVVISRGLGNSVFPVRVLNFPEIVCIDLKCA